MASVLKYFAFGLMMLFAVIGSAFIVGEAATDPGGTTAVLYTAAWAVPMVALAVYAVWRPEPATMVLAAVAAIVALFVVLDAAFEIVPRDEIGPVGSVAVLAVAVALGFLGLHRSVPAGWLLLLVGGANLAGPLVRVLTSTDGGPVGLVGGSSGAVAIPAIVIGGLFLVAGYLEPDTRSHGQSTRLPMSGVSR